MGTGQQDNKEAGDLQINLPFSNEENLKLFQASLEKELEEAGISYTEKTIENVY